MSGRRRRYAVVAGGGTAGHVIPAVAVAQILVARRGPGSVELVGARRGLEARTPLVGDLPITLLPGRGLLRRLDRAAWWANGRALVELGLAAGMAFGVLWRRRPAVVVSVGGFASVPVAVVAAVLGVPVVVVNVDAVPGLANRLVARFARVSAVAHPGTALPRAVVTGAPVRPEIAAAAGAGAEASGRDQGRRALGLPVDRVVVAVVGGSLGARRLNEATLELAAAWAGRPDVAIYHVVGQRDAPAAAQTARNSPALAAAVADSAATDRAPAGLWYRQVAYEAEMPTLYQAADVVVGRAGAMTVAELAAVGVASVLVPLPGAPGDHQAANARVLEQAGAAVVLADAACDGPGLADVLGPLVDDGDRRRAMAVAAATLGRPDAAEAVATVAEAHARPGWSSW